MKLNIYIEDRSYELDVPQELIDEGGDFFAQMDRDMDQGIQMSRRYVENPNTIQRCQMAADKILTAVETRNNDLALMMGAYILARLPGIEGVRIDTCGETFNTEMIMATQPQ